MNVSSFDDTQAGLEEAKLTYQRCKAYANGVCKGTEMEEIPQDVRKRMDDNMKKKKNHLVARGACISLIEPGITCFTILWNSLKNIAFFKCS